MLWFIPVYCWGGGCRYCEKSIRCFYEEDHSIAVGECLDKAVLDVYGTSAYVRQLWKLPRGHKDKLASLASSSPSSSDPAKSSMDQSGISSMLKGHSNWDNLSFCYGIFFWITSRIGHLNTKGYDETRQRDSKNNVKYSSCNREMTTQHQSHLI